MIRLADKEDLPHIVAMGIRFMNETPYVRYITQDTDKMFELAEKLIDSPNGLLLVNTEADEINGMIGVYAFCHPMSGEIVASEMFWWVDPEARGLSGVRLLRCAEDWAVKVGAQRMMMIAPNDRVGEFYRRVGYDRVETTYMRRLA